MKVKLYADLCKKVGLPIMRKFGVQEDRSWQNHEVIDLIGVHLDDVKELLDLIEPYASGSGKIKGTKKAVRNLELWIKIQENGLEDKLKAKNVKHFSILLSTFLSKVDGHRLFDQEEDNGINLCYYVEKIVYFPKKVERSRHGTHVTPAHVTMNLFWLRYGGIDRKMETFWIQNCQNMTVTQALNKQGYFAETPELRKTYLDEKKRYQTEVANIGKQFLAEGEADEEGSRWHSSAIILDKDGEMANVVIDVFSEEKDKKHVDYDSEIDKYFWKKQIIEDPKKAVEEDEDDDSGEDEDEVDEEVVERMQNDRPEIPLHPYLMIFDLKRHARAWVHINQLTEYVYDETLGDKLILPPENKDLIATLLSYEAGFQDVISGKGNGIIVLCSGAPGTGKTLTAEIFSHMSKKPLYNVQCSQLGLTAEELEENLMKILERARRWKCLLLLDEADVYVAQRGANIEQNAIVGVFLRVLEYYRGILFMTTNRGEIVDDAIASRCVARIDYTTPTIEDQRKIWAVLSETTGVEISKKDLDKIIEKHNKLSGRDIKSLLKLAVMVTKRTKKPVTAETIDFCKKFKPTLE